MDRQRVIAGVFDRAAATYDAVGVSMFGPIAEHLVARLAPQPGERLLDVGCGRGAVLIRAARMVGPTGRAAGLDLSPAMVDAARREAAEAGVAVDVMVGDAADPDLPPHSFDVVASSLVLFFLPDLVGALRAWRGLLVPGGRVGVTTFGGYGDAWAAVDATVMSRAPAGMRDPRLRDPEGPFASDEAMERLFGEAGLTDIASVTSVIPVRFEDEDQWYRWSWSLGQRGVWETLSQSERDTVRADAYERLQDCRDDRGRIGFDQEVRCTLAVR